MTLNLYRIWLPISVLFHIMLYLAIQFVPIQAASLPGAKAITVDLVQLNETSNVPAEQTLPTPVTPKIQPSTEIQVRTNKGRVNTPGGITVTSTNPRSSQFPGPKITGKPKGAVGLGTSLKRSKATDVMTSNNSQEETPIAPPGSLNPGTGGPGNLPEGGGSGDGGETRGVSTLNLYIPLYPKNALNERREGDVIVLVSVDEDGKLAADVTKGSGSPDLDKTAIRAALKSSYGIALKNGKKWEAPFP